MSEPILTITSQEDAIELVLTQDSVRMKLSEHVLEEARRDLATDPDAQKPGWVGSFARAVTGAVGKLLSSYIEYALYDIESVVERNGALVFTYHRRHRPSFEDISFVAHGKRLTALEAFTPSDAAAFAEQFAALKAHSQG